MSHSGASAALSARELIGYGVGDLGINLYFISVMTYLLLFYTDVFGLSATAAGGVLLVARWVDAFTDPLMGMLAERTRTRWGRMRPHILFGALPLGLISVLTFTAFDGSPGQKLWWAYTTYILFGIAYTVVSMPYGALTASITNSSEERTRLSTVRMACAFSGGFIVSVGTLPLVNLFEDRASGFFWVMVGFSVIATLLLLLTVRATDEKVQPPAQQKLALRDSLSAVLANPHLWIVMALFTLGMLSFTVRQTVTAFYFIYNVGRPDLIPWFFGITLSVMLVGLVSVPWLADRFGKAGGIALGAAVGMVGSVGLYFTSYDAHLLIFFWGCVVALGGTPIAVLGWAMIPDTVEYAQLKHGVRADGTIFSVATFFQKLAKMLGGAAVAFALGLAGYVANAEQSASALRAIHIMFTWVPFAIMLMMIVAARSYRLDSAAHRRIVSELRAQTNEG